MKYHFMALAVMAFFGTAVTWIKLNGGKITAWLRVVGSICKFTADMNETCADGKAEPEEMQKLCSDWNEFMGNLGFLKKGALEKMKKPIITAVIALMAICLTSTAHADIFNPIGQETKQKASQPMAIPGVDADTILAEVAQITAYLGVREGGLYDFGQHEFCNYAAATIVTYAPWGISLDLGLVNTDGFASTVDFNVGAMIPVENVPLLNLFKYLYVGGGVAERSIDGNWKTSGVLDGQFKFTF